MAKTVWGLEDFQDRGGQWVRSFYKYGVQYHTISDGRWLDVCKRTQVGGRYQTLKPSYKGSQNKFVDFQEFTEWSKDQVGYNCKEDNGNFWSLDKDLLVEGNKNYSKETCIFVPNKVNCFFLACNLNRGEFPVGVSRIKSGSYVAYGQSSQGQRKLGVFKSIKEAHQSWQENRIVQAYLLADEYKHTHPQLYQALLNKIYLLQEDLRLGRETIIK